MNCIEILIKAGASKNQAKALAPGLSVTLKKMGFEEPEEEEEKESEEKEETIKPKKKTRKILESRDITEPKNTYKVK